MSPIVTLAIRPTTLFVLTVNPDTHSARAEINAQPSLTAVVLPALIVFTTGTQTQVNV